MRLFSLLALLPFISFGCNQLPAGLDTAGATLTLERFIEDLEGLGATVARAGAVDQPFFDGQGVRLTVDEEEVQTFLFATPQHANAAAEQIRPDGTAIVSGQSVTSISWVAPPHFFRHDELIVLYVGSSDVILGYLLTILGPQFAGG